MIACCKFPRLQRRGPIEAGLALAPVLTGQEFPRLQRRGPIEASLQQKGQ